MTRAQELIKKIESATIEEMLDGTQERWSEELVQYEEGQRYYDMRREQQKQSFKEIKERLLENLKNYPEA